MKSIFVSALLVILGIASAVNGQFNESKTARKAAEKLTKGDRTGAIAILDKAIQQRKDLLEAHKMRGNVRSMGGDLDGAIADYSAVLEINPNDAEMYEQRAMFRTFKRDYSGALKDYNAAIANGLKSEKVYSGSAAVKRDMGDMEGSIADYQTAIAINPNFASAHIGLSITFEKKGDLNGAMVHLQDFLDRYEGKRNGKLPKLTNGQPIGESISIKRDGKETDGSQVFMVGNEVTASYSAKTPEEAEKKQANMEQLMNVSLAYFNLGRIYAKKDELDKALENYEKGMKIKKDDPYAYGLRSDIRIKKGDLQGAIDDLTFVVKSPLRSPGFHFENALLLVLQGKDGEAEKELALHLQMFPGAKEGLDKRIEEAKKLRSSQPTN